MKNNSSRVSFNDRVLAREVRNLGLEELKKILDPKYMPEGDVVEDRTCNC
jgi:hypothetical protein